MAELSLRCKLPLQEHCSRNGSFQAQPCYHLEMSLFVSEHGVCECCNEACLAVVAPVPQAEEGGEDAGDDEDRQQDDQRGREGGGGHADVALRRKG